MAGEQPGGNALFLGPSVHRSGLVGVALSGDIEVDTIVAQGCRPVGLPMFVTKAHGNVIWELDGRRAVEVLQELFADLSAADQELARHLAVSRHRHDRGPAGVSARRLLDSQSDRHGPGAAARW